MDDIISSLTNAFTLALVVTSMFGLGLGLTVQQIVEPHGWRSGGELRGLRN